MKVVAVDQFEFEHPSTEESVEIAIAERSAFPFPSAASFVAARIGVESSKALPAPSPFSQAFGSQQAREHLFKFAAIELPELCSWETYWFSADPDEWALVISAPGQFIHYRWSSSA